MHLEENVALAPLTTLGVGGKARFLLRAESSDDVVSAIRFAENRELPIFVLGGGSNVLISDNGWPGLVLQIATTGVEDEERDGKISFNVGAGEDWDKFVARCVKRDCAGVECLSGIPGSVGGTPVQNVGAYGQEVSEVIVSVLAFDRAEIKVRELNATECGFRYRSSIFNTTERERYIILRVRYALTPGGFPSLRYADLQKYFADRSTTPTLSDVRRAVCSIRRSKGMLIVPGDPDSQSAGSFFKNPILTSPQFLDLSRRAKERGLEVPAYPALSEQKKISAAWLVEHSGFAKGYIKGRAGISSKHALALINRGEASAAEILALKNEIQERVKTTWGIILEPEPVCVGF